MPEPAHTRSSWLGVTDCCVTATLHWRVEGRCRALRERERRESFSSLILPHARRILGIVNTWVVQFWTTDSSAALFSVSRRGCKINLYFIMLKFLIIIIALFHFQTI